MRNLKEREIILLKFLLKDSSKRYNFDELKVIEMSNGMGSIKFCSENNNERKHAVIIAEETFTDDDGIPVLVTLFSNDKGFLYELDFFKADFSNLIQYPQPKNS